MRKYVRPAVITFSAAAIVLAAAIFAASRSANSDYSAMEHIDFVRVMKSVPAPHDIALKGTGQMRFAAAPNPSAAKSARSGVQIARTGSVSLFVPNVDKAIDVYKRQVRLRPDRQSFYGSRNARRFRGLLFPAIHRSRHTPIRFVSRLGWTRSGHRDGRFRLSDRHA